MNEFAALLYDKVNNLAGRTKNTCPMQQKYKPFSGWKYGKVRPRSRTYNVLSLFFFMLIAYLKDWIQKKRQNWVGIFRENNLMSTDYPPCFKTPT
jgi:ribosome modulation factor